MGKFLLIDTMVEEHYDIGQGAVRGSDVPATGTNYSAGFSDEGEGG